VIDGTRGGYIGHPIVKGTGTSLTPNQCGAKVVCMNKRTSWYSEKGTTVRPSATPGHVDLYRCGKFIATVKA
jgi:hypothetical protein